MTATDTATSMTFSDGFPKASAYGLNCQFTRGVIAKDDPMSLSGARREYDYAEMMGQRVHTSGAKHDEWMRRAAYWWAVVLFYEQRGH